MNYVVPSSIHRFKIQKSKSINMIEFLSSKMKKLLPNPSPNRSRTATAPKKESTLPPPRLILFAGKGPPKPVKISPQEDSIPILQKEAKTSLVEENDSNSSSTSPEEQDDEKELVTTDADAINNNYRSSSRPSTVVAARTWKRLIGLPYETSNETDTEEMTERQATPKLVDTPPPPPPTAVIQVQPTLVAEPPPPTPVIQPTKAPPPTAVPVEVPIPISPDLSEPPKSVLTPSGPQPLVREKVHEIVPHTGSSALDFSIPLRIKSKKLPPTQSATSQRKSMPQQPHPRSAVLKRMETNFVPRPETARGHNQTIQKQYTVQSSPTAKISQSHPVNTATPVHSSVDNVAVIDPSSRPTTATSALVPSSVIVNVNVDTPSRPTSAASISRKTTDKSKSQTLASKTSSTSTTQVPPPPHPSKASIFRNTAKNYTTPSSGVLLAKNKQFTHKLAPAKGESSPQSTKIKKKKISVKFVSPSAALAKERKELDMVACLDGCTSYEDAPIWLCFRLWDYAENLKQLKKFIKLGIEGECRGDEIADMKKIFDFHGMNTCLDCFMLDEECNMRNVGYIIDDDVLISFNNILPYMTQYFVDLRDTFYGKCPAQNALIRQWINYCVRNIRGRRVSEYMWEEMNDHLGIDGFFGGSYRTMADTLMYVSLYNRVRRWEPQDFAKRYNLTHWFRLMQMDERLRGGNQLLDVPPSSEFHPNYPFDYIEPDILDLNKELKVKDGKIVEVSIAKKLKRLKA